MASQSDLQRLRRRLGELERIESKYKELQERFEEQKLSVDHWKNAHDNLMHRVKELQVKVEEAKERSSALEVQLTESRTECDETKKLLEKREKAMKVDGIARDGMTKKLRVLEHEAASYKEEVAKLNSLIETLSRKASQIESQWLQERSMRLQDMHRNDALASKNSTAADDVMQAEEKWLQAEEDKHHAQQTSELKEMELKAQKRVTEALRGEIDAQAQEMAMLRQEILKLKKDVMAKEGNIAGDALAQYTLQRELQRLQKELVLTSSKQGRSTFTTQSERARMVTTRGTPSPPSNGLLASLAGVGTRTGSSSSSKYATPGAGWKSRGNGSPGTAGTFPRGLVNSETWGSIFHTADDFKTEPSKLRSKHLGANSTLHVPGSLFIGSGLKYRKPATYSLPSHAAIIHATTFTTFQKEK